MAELPEYVQQAINEGRAFATDNRGFVENIVRERLMPYVQRLDNSYIDEEVETWTNELVDNHDYMYYLDLDLGIMDFVPDYVRLTVELMLKEAEKNIKKVTEESKKSGNDK